MTITVTVPSTIISVTSVTLNKSSLSLTGVGSTEKLSATVNPSDATNKNVSWKSSNTAVATVSSDGTVKAIGAGSATITVTTEDGNKTATVTVRVIVPAKEKNNSDSTLYIVCGVGTVLLGGLYIFRKSIFKAIR